MKPDIKIAPTSSKQRIAILDVIRGFAIFGILLANIQSWSGYKFISFGTIALLPHYEYDNLLHYLFMFFIDTKFYALFSILFGIGFYLQFAKYRQNQDEFIPTYRRRLSFLMLFGAIHAFFWSGDILFIYGAIGFIFILFRNLQPKQIFWSAVVLYYIWLLYDLVISLYFPEAFSYKHLSHKTYPDISPEGLTYIFQHGSFYEVLQANWHNLYYRYIDLIPSGRLFKVLALFLFGYYLMSINYFTKYARSLKLFFIYFLFGSIFTYISYEVGGHMAEFSINSANLLYKFLAITGQIFLALSYINLLTLLYEKSFFTKILHLFSYVGKMSFTNYLSHTLFGYLIFYPFFGAYFGKIDLFTLFFIAIGVYTIQILFSYIWLKYFKFGPLEWVWRCLTYKKLFTLRK